MKCYRVDHNRASSSLLDQVGYILIYLMNVYLYGLYVTYSYHNPKKKSTLEIVQQWCLWCLIIVYWPRSQWRRMCKFCSRVGWSNRFGRDFGVRRRWKFLRSYRVLADRPRPHTDNCAWIGDRFSRTGYYFTKNRKIIILKKNLELNVIKVSERSVRGFIHLINDVIR